jgi:hypothetical protein
VAYDAHVKPETPDRVADDAHEFLLGAPIADSDCYIHVRDVERMIKDRPEWFHETETPDPEDYDTEEKVVDRLIEQWNANPKF